MLSISEFSEMCQLSAQTLRFYHSEELLLPAKVDEQTGYRSYTFDQVEQAMLITVLRGTGMSVKAVRRALDEPDQASGLLEQHCEELRSQREAQDEAIRDAHELLRAWPEVRRIDVPEMTVVSTLLPGPPEPREDDYDWEHVDRATSEVIDRVAAAVEAAGGTVTGTPWRSLAIETREQKRNAISAAGPHWLVKVPVELEATATAALPEDLEVQTFAAREELSIFMPGRSTMAKYATAISRLLSHRMENAMASPLEIRSVIRPDGNEINGQIMYLDDADDLDDSDDSDDPD